MPSAPRVPSAVLLGCSQLVTFMPRDAISSSCSKQEVDTEAAQRKGLGSYEESTYFLQLLGIFQLHFICQHRHAVREAEKSNLLNVYLQMQTKQKDSVRKK